MVMVSMLVVSGENHQLKWSDYQTVRCGPGQFYRTFHLNDHEYHESAIAMVTASEGLPLPS